MIIADSSPIIALGKEGLLDLLKKCFGTVIIPESVYIEVAEKKENPESLALEKAIEEKWIVVEKAALSPFLSTEKIGKAEKEAISLAARHKADVLLDDDAAKSYASIMGVEAHGTVYVLFLSCRKRIISKEQAITAFEGMVKNGFYVSTGVYMRFKALLESMA